MADLTTVVRSVLRERYNIVAAVIEGQPGGQDDEASVFRVHAGPGSGSAGVPTHLAKVRPHRDGGLLGPGVARYLTSRGMPDVVAPIPSLDGATTSGAGELLVTVYPFVDGAPGARVGLSDAQWTELGRFVRCLHELELPQELAARLPVESFVPTGLDVMPDLLAQMEHLTGRPGALESVVSTWTAHRDRIAGLVARTVDLSARMRGRSFALVTCHADLHTFNVLVDGSGGLHVVDWDEVVRAPRERDLMFFVGGGISEDWMPRRGTEPFLLGYGDAGFDAEAVAYYRHAWAIQDISSYTIRVLDDHRGEAGAVEAADILAGLFRPSEIVDLSERDAG